MMQHALCCNADLYEVLRDHKFHEQLLCLEEVREQVKLELLLKN